MVSDERVLELKKILNKQGVKYDDEATYSEVANGLVDFYGMLGEWEDEERRLKQRLNESPKGFAISGEGRNCPLCRRSIAEDMWYDKWGQKCMSCQGALDQKIVPGYCFDDYKNEKHITDQTMKLKLNVRTATIRKLVRHGELKARIVPGSGVLVFLKKENPNLVEIIEAYRQDSKS